MTALGHARLPRHAVFFYSRDYSFFVLYTGIHLARIVPRRWQRSTALQRYTAVYRRSTAGLQYTALQRYTVYSGIHSPSGSRFVYISVCVGASSTPRPNTDTAPSHMGGAQSRRASSRRRVLILRGALIPYAVATLSGRTCVRRKPMGRDKRCTVYPPSGSITVDVVT